jgi:hypothetical protein
MSINAIPSSIFNKIQNKEQELKSAGIEFEKMFLKPHFSQILNEEENSALFGESYGGKMWRSLFVEEIVNACAGRMGIDQMIQESIHKKTNPYEAISADHHESKEGVYA